jgi:hypothetical protein
MHLLLSWLTLKHHMTYTYIHTFPLHSYTMSGTHPMSRTQDISTCRHFWSGVHHCSTQGNLLLLPQSSMLLHKNEGSPVVLLCLQEIPQDITVKRYVELLNRRTMSIPVFLYVLYRVQQKPKQETYQTLYYTRNQDDVPSSHESKYVYCHYTS